MSLRCSTRVYGDVMVIRLLFKLDEKTKADGIPLYVVHVSIAQFA